MILSVFVFINNRKSLENKFFILVTLFTGIWCLYPFLSYNIKEPNIAIFYSRFLYLFAVIDPAIFLHFTLILLGVNKTRSKKYIIKLTYLCSLLLLAFVFSPLFIKGIERHKSFSSIIPGPIYTLFVVFFGLACLYAFYSVVQSYRISSASYQNKLKYLFIAFAIAFVSGIFHFMPVYIGIEPIPHDIFVVTYTFIIFYAIFRHHLMDIEVVIKKTLVFASLFAIVLAIFIGVTLVTQQFIAGGRLLGLAISSFVIILAVRPLEDLLVRATDNYLFQRKYDYKQVLKAFIDEVITVLSLDSVIQSTIELLDKTLHPEAVEILILNRLEDKYVSFGTNSRGREIYLESSSIIPTLLKSTKDIFSVEGSSASVEVTGELRGEMKRLNARLAIPLMLHNDLIGIMLLGKKKSDEEYTKDDLDILNDLARTEAVAVGNAQLFAETAQNERRAAIGTLAAGINHEIGNPLNIINTKMQVYLMSLGRGLYKDKKPEEIVKESKNIMNLCLQQTTRISEITKKLSSFAKPSKDFKPELTDIEEQINDTLAVIGHELEMERVEIKMDIQKDLPKISADKRQIQQVFFNIIKNAGQAIKDKGIVEIKVYDAKDGNVRIEISDTGGGIPEDKIDKIYEPFFTTKEPGKGTGLGLSIVRQLVWRNKGDIKVKSKVGEGTMFTITFPVGK
jgi:signal transduction histidine kinase